MSPSAPDLEGLRIPRAPQPRRRAAPVLLLVGAASLLLIGSAIAWYRRSQVVTVGTAVAREVARNGRDHTVLNASGYVTARRQATVSSKVTGKVDEISIEEGVHVVAGQVLARLDQTNVRASLDLSRTQADAARAALAETRVRLHEANQELARQTSLRERAVAAQSDFDHAEAAALALRARLEQQQAEAAVAEQTVHLWQQQLNDTIIRAPFTGTVTSKNAQPGEMISPMSTGGFTRTGICTIVDMQSLEIEIDVNESYINRVQPDQPVEAMLDAYPEWKIPCHVIAIIPTADRNKSTVRVRVGFDRLDPRILPDMSVKVAFRETAAEARPAQPRVLVPKAAVVLRDNRTVVFVVRRHRAERRAVTVGEDDGDAIELSSGLAAGERVVLNPPTALADRMAIQEATP